MMTCRRCSWLSKPKSCRNELEIRAVFGQEGAYPSQPDRLSCPSASKIDPTYCLTSECYPGEACSTPEAVGGSGLP